MEYCKKCGKEMESTSNFCSNCGYKKNDDGKLKKEKKFSYEQIGSTIFTILAIILSCIRTRFLSVTGGGYISGFVSAPGGILTVLGYIALLAAIVSVIVVFIKDKIKNKYIVGLNVSYTSIFVFKYICLMSGIIADRVYKVNLLATIIIICSIISTLLMIKNIFKLKKHIKLFFALGIIVILIGTFGIRVHNIERFNESKNTKLVLTSEMIESIKKDVINYTGDKFNFYWESSIIRAANARVEAGTPDTKGVQKYTYCDVTGMEVDDMYVFKVYGNIYGKDKFNRDSMQKIYLDVYCEKDDELESGYKIVNGGFEMSEPHIF